jgi:hypothetical protein
MDAVIISKETTKLIEYLATTKITISEKITVLRSSADMLHNIMNGEALVIEMGNYIARSMEE